MDTLLIGRHQHICPQCFAHPDHETDAPCQYPEYTRCPNCPPRDTHLATSCQEV